MQSIGHRRSYKLLNIPKKAPAGGKTGRQNIIKRKKSKISQQKFNLVPSFQLPIEATKV
jgi:hypothetical protein